MAEQEIVKHAKEAYNALNNPTIGWKHKLKDVLFEILIIVFAVTLSIWLHDWNEKRHERKEAHEFLQGLKIDLQSDIKEMSNDLATYRNVKKGAIYFRKVAYGDTLNKDSLRAYRFIFFNTTLLNPNISRFEGLKASGKMNIIENKELLNKILDFYQENIPFINLLNNGYNKYKMERMGPMLDQRLVYDRYGNANWEQALREPEIQNALRRAESVDDTISEYGKAIYNGEELIRLIDSEMK